MNINAPIIAGLSLGNISIGDSTESFLEDVYNNKHDIELNVYNNDLGILHSYKIDGGVITINTRDNLVVSLFCKKPYKGKYNNKLWPGMSIAQIKNVSSKQMLIFSALVLDNEWGVCFSLPQPYDEYDYIYQLPDDLILESLFVMNPSWRGY